MNPDGFTLRELCWMQAGRDADAWNHTASLIAHIRAALGDKKATPKEYHPHYARTNTISAKTAFQMIAAKHHKEPK